MFKDAAEVPFANASNIFPEPYISQIEETVSGALPEVVVRSPSVFVAVTVTA